MPSKATTRQRRNCITCLYTAGANTSPCGVLFASRYWLVEHAFGTTLPGFCIIKTKRHVEDIGELKDNEAQELGTLIQKVARAAQKACRTRNVYILKFGEVVKHLHIWILPITPRTQTKVGKGPCAIPLIMEYYMGMDIPSSRMRSIERTATKIRRILHGTN